MIQAARPLTSFAVLPLAALISSFGDQGNFCDDLEDDHLPKIAVAAMGST